ncbi:ABC transporter substrate-binding protein [Neorhizobium sp. P12A]|uniref:ABC transporter substrate-binding protein n=1 Tax=Neorhizobium sp. P12A TaxID=2268027 RepID=UPI0011F06808|nr:ABC transporter substrate-binding protein [Neorhizobium sp. P12A]KAA0693376.1 ABC transporter substrate-binding protein [Neorhizobium sp. P12A]
MRNHLSLATTFAASLAFVAPAYADFTIGVIAPLTGPGSADGDKVKYARQAAADEIDKNDGILGDKLVLEFGDDASDPLKSSSVAKDLLDENQFCHRGGGF